MRIAENLLSELDDVIADGTIERRHQALNHVTALFMASQPTAAPEWIEAIDELFVRLAERIEEEARRELACKLAGSSHAPAKIIKRLATDESINVAGPVLSNSEVLDEASIIEVVKSRSQEFLLAVSSRRELRPPVTDILIARGDREVIHRTAANTGARFSSDGYQKLTSKALQDEELAQAIIVRTDLPRRLFLEVLQNASDAVRKKLQAALPGLKAEIAQTISSVTARIEAQSLPATHEYSQAHAAVQALETSGTLIEAEIRNFASAGKRPELTVALARFGKLPIEVVERALDQERTELVLIVARAIGLTWPTLKAILLLRCGPGGLPTAALDQALRHFERLKPTTAQQALRFYLLRNGKKPGNAA